MILADARQIKSALMNLCVNARDAIEEAMGKDPSYIPEEGRFQITLETDRVEIDTDYCKQYSYAQPGSYALLSVSDNGIGMDQETLRHIFEPFFSTKEVGKGCGLGLASAYGVVKEHYGWIHVDSEPGRGTRIEIYLPVGEIMGKWRLLSCDLYPVQYHSSAGCNMCFSLSGSPHGVVLSLSTY